MSNLKNLFEFTPENIVIRQGGATSFKVTKLSNFETINSGLVKINEFRLDHIKLLSDKKTLLIVD